MAAFAAALAIGRRWFFTPPSHRRAAVNHAGQASAILDKGSKFSDPWLDPVSRDSREGSVSPISARAEKRKESAGLPRFLTNSR